MKIISRKEARSQGLTHYFTGKPCKNGHISKRRVSRADCLDCIRNNDRKRYSENPEKFKKRQSEIYKKSSEKIKARASRYYNCNKNKVNKYKLKWFKSKISSDPLFLLSVRCRGLITASFAKKGYSKNTKTEIMLGCDWKTLKSHIERQFTKGMSWDRMSEIHIDHIIPLSSAKTKEDIIALNHYTNLRPMWAKENMSKGAKMEFLI